MDGAANAAVGQCHHLYRLIAQQLGIDTGIAEFILDHGDFQAVLGLEQVTQQSGLAGAEEAAEDCDRDGRGQTGSPFSHSEKTTQNKCGSELTRDRGLTFNITVD
ncbi:hypothetical protein D9M71_706910 [compost metagenome]